MHSKPSIKSRTKIGLIFYQKNTFLHSVLFSHPTLSHPQTQLPTNKPSVLDKPSAHKPNHRTAKSKKSSPPNSTRFFPPLPTSQNTTTNSCRITTTVPDTYRRVSKPEHFWIRAAATRISRMSSGRWRWKGAVSRMR